MNYFFNLSHCLSLLAVLLLIFFIYSKKKIFSIFVKPYNLLKFFLITLFVLLLLIKLDILAVPLTCKSIDDLKIVEGQCLVEGGTRYKKIFVNDKLIRFRLPSKTRFAYFNFRKWHKKYLKVWYYESEAYQIEIDDQIIYGLSEANEDILYFNFIIMLDLYLPIILLCMVFVLERLE